MKDVIIYAHQDAHTKLFSRIYSNLSKGSLQIPYFVLRSASKTNYNHKEFEKAWAQRVTLGNDKIWKFPVSSYRAPEKKNKLAQ